MGNLILVYKKNGNDFKIDNLLFVSVYYKIEIFEKNGGNKSPKKLVFYFLYGSSFHNILFSKFDHEAFLDL